MKYFYFLFLGCLFLNAQIGFCTSEISDAKLLYRDYENKIAQAKESKDHKHQKKLAVLENRLAVLGAYLQSLEEAQTTKNVLYEVIRPKKKVMDEFSKEIAELKKRNSDQDN